MRTLRSALLLLALTILVALPVAADEATAPATEAPPAQPAEDPGAEPGAEPLPELDLFLPEAQQKLYCSEYCGDGIYVSCSCLGSGTCTSQSGPGGYVECLCDNGSDDEEACPISTGECENPPSKCIPGAACTQACGCAEGTCMPSTNTCNCLA